LWLRSGRWQGWRDPQMAGRNDGATSLPPGSGEPTAQGRVWPSPLQFLGSALRVPLYRSSSALVLTTVFNAGLGLVFWTLAARLYSVEEVGTGAAAVASLQLVSMLGCTGLTPALIRLMPPTRSGTLRLVQWIYLSGVMLALVCGAGVLVATELLIEPLGVPGIVYLTAIPIWAVFTLQDGALIGLRREAWVPAENAVYGIVKIVLLLAFSTGGAWGIFVSWSISAVLLVVPINLLLFSKLIPQHAARESDQQEEFSLAEVRRFAGGNHISGLLMAVPDFLMPIIVLQIEGAENTAFFYAAWQLVWPLRLVGTNIANAFTAQAASATIRYDSGPVCFSSTSSCSPLRIAANCWAGKSRRRSIPIALTTGGESANSFARVSCKNDGVTYSTSLNDTTSSSPPAERANSRSVG